MALIRSARPCSWLQHVQIYTLHSANVCHPEAVALLSDEASCGSHRGFWSEEVRRNHS